eukprot:111171_1
MEHLYNSLLTLRTHKFHVDKRTLSPIVPHSCGQFVVYKDLSLDVRGIVETAMSVSKGKFMWKARETILSHFQSINHRKRNEITVIVRFWSNGCRMLLDKNVTNLISDWSAFLNITSQIELFTLLHQYVGAIKESGNM